MEHKRKALIVGATGLVGGVCVQRLLDSSRYEKIVTFGRSSLELEHPKLIQLTGSIDNVESVLKDCDVDDIFCCIGTTIKKAKSKSAFRKVDFEYPLNIARLMKVQGAEHFCVVSALGSDPSSKVFYNRTKGELERELEKIGYPYLSIMRPSLLTGERKEFRFGEAMSAGVGKLLRPLFIGPLSEVRPIDAGLVAKAMVGEGERIADGVRKKGVEVITSRQMQAC